MSGSIYFAGCVNTKEQNVSATLALSEAWERTGSDEGDMFSGSTQQAWSSLEERERPATALPRVFLLKQLVLSLDMAQM